MVVRSAAVILGLGLLAVLGVVACAPRASTPAPEPATTATTVPVDTPMPAPTIATAIPTPAATATPDTRRRSLDTYRRAHANPGSAARRPSRPGRHL